MLFEKTRKKLAKAIGSSKPTCRGATRAAMRRGLRSPQRWMLANQQSLPFRLKKVEAFVKAIKEKMNPDAASADAAAVKE